jgi:hypothetical protein
MYSNHREAFVCGLQVRSSKQDQIHNSIVSTLLALMDGLTSRGQVRYCNAARSLHYCQCHPHASGQGFSCGASSSAAASTAWGNSTVTKIPSTYIHRHPPSMLPRRWLSLAPQIDQTRWTRPCGGRAALTGSCCFRCPMWRRGRRFWASTHAAGQSAHHSRC